MERLMVLSTSFFSGFLCISNCEPWPHPRWGYTWHRRTQNSLWSLGEKRTNFCSCRPLFSAIFASHSYMLSAYTLQMKGRWVSNINVWFPFMYSQKWNWAASLFPKQNYNVLSPNSYTHISVRDLYISRIGLSILLQPNVWTDTGNIKSLTDTWMWKLELRPRNS
jgi:hypothetical protein